MRHEPSFLKDILSACRKIDEIVAATNEDLFPDDEVLPAAVLHHLTVIGEEIRVLRVPIRLKHPTGTPASVRVPAAVALR
jgi:uncharacterized protein with HEPN domain